jgi:O-antigen ligase
LQYIIEPNYYSWFTFEKKITLLIIPVVFFNLNSEAIKLKRVLTAFVLAASTLCVIGIGYLIIWGPNPEFLGGGNSFAIRTTLENILLIHPTYLSIITVFSASILISNLFSNPDSKFKFLWLLGIALQTTFVMIIASRIGIIGLFMTLIFMSFFHRKILKSKLKFIILGIALTGFASWLIPSSNERIQELIETAVSDNQVETNGTNVRQSIYYCTTLLIKQSWLAGIGTASLQEHLNTCYFMVAAVDIVDNNFNTHNEYLNVWLGLGLLGLIVFLTLIINSFYWAKGNDIHLVFLLLFSLFCFTENLLERQVGVLFFTLWNSYFLISKWNKNEN